MAAIAAMALSMSSVAAGAEEPYQPGWREVWAGADVTSHVWLIYSGATVAPQANIYEDGLRLRIAGGSGGYSTPGSGAASSSPSPPKPPSPKPWWAT